MKLSKESNSNSQTTIFILFSTPLNETEERRHDLVAIYVYSFTFNSPLFLRIFSPFFSHHKTRENWMIIGIPSTRKGRNKTRLVVSPFTLLPSFRFIPTQWISKWIWIEHSSVPLFPPILDKDIFKIVCSQGLNAPFFARFFLGGMEKCLSTIN